MPNYRAIYRDYDVFIPGPYGPVRTHRDRLLWPAHFQPPTEYTRQIIVQEGEGLCSSLHSNEWKIILQQQIPRKIGRLALGFRWKSIETLKDSETNVSR